MSRFFICILLLLTGILFSACTPPAKNEPPKLDNTSWYALNIGDLTPAQDKSSTLYFGKDGISGSTGCNRYFGSHTLEGEKITFSQIGSTMMFCEETAQQETAFLNALKAAAGYRVTEGKLVLSDKAGQTLVTLAPIQHAELGGPTWNLTMLNNGKQAVSSLPKGIEISAQFKEGRVQGSAGCNTYFASYKVEGEQLTISNPGSTKKMCSQPEGVMAQESLFLQALGNAARFEIREQTLTVYGADNQVLMKFSARP
jgi:heat shock protein HslJ